MKRIYALFVSLLMIVAGFTLAANPAYAHPFCGSGYVCAYDDQAGTSLLFKIYWTSWAQSLCYPMGRYANRISYLVNDSSHNFVVSTNTSCSGTTAPVYANSYGAMAYPWNNSIESSFRVD